MNLAEKKRRRKHDFFPSLTLKSILLVLHHFKIRINVRNLIFISLERSLMFSLSYLQYVKLRRRRLNLNIRMLNYSILTFVIIINSDVYYRDVWLFLEQARSIAQVKSLDVVRANLHICLRDSAQAWYATKLDSDIRYSLREGEDLARWREYLD